MQTKILPLIFLSLCGFSSCQHNEFADKPEGWNCTYFFDKENSPFLLIEQLKVAETPEQVAALVSQLKDLKADRTQFFCNGIKSPDVEKQFHFADPIIHKSRCMPLETAEKYDKYILKKIADIENKCRNGAY